MLPGYPALGWATTQVYPAPKRRCTSSRSSVDGSSPGSCLKTDMRALSIRQPWPSSRSLPRAFSKADKDHPMDDLTSRFLDSFATIEKHLRGTFSDAADRRGQFHQWTQRQ